MNLTDFSEIFSGAPSEKITQAWRGLANCSDFSEALRVRPPACMRDL